MMKNRPSSKDVQVNFEMAVRLYAIGHSLQEAATRANVSVSSLKSYLKKDEAKFIINSIRKDIEEEFMNLQGRVVEVLRNALDCPDIPTALAAANIWLKSARSNKVDISLSNKDIKELSDEELITLIKEEKIRELESSS